MIKKITAFVYVALLMVMAAATMIENSQGTDYAHSAIYGSWWFTLLWAVLTATGIAYLIKRRVRHYGTWAIHISLVIILLGALLTHLTSTKGMMHLREGETSNAYVMGDGHHGMQTALLPFSMRLHKFVTTYHDGTDAVADYASTFTVTDGNTQQEGQVSMNNIFSYRSYRFYQSSYDPDGHGTVLAVNSDPWGIPVTYTGYALLFVSLIFMLFAPKGQYRQVLRSPLLRKGAIVAMLLFSATTASHAQSTVPLETADRLGRLCMLYNNRICPVETYAIDFCKKIYGARSYKGLTAEQVLAGWIFYGDQWASEPFIRVKGSELRDHLGLADSHCAMATFFQMGQYTLGPLVQEYYQGNTDKLHKQAMDLDNSLMLLMQLRSGQSLHLLPYTTKRGVTTWYAPTDSLPHNISAQQALYIHQVFPLMAEDVVAGRWTRVNEFLDKMHHYQQVFGGHSLPSATQYKAERLGNAVPFATVLFMVNLTLGFIALFYIIGRMTQARWITPRLRRLADWGFAILLGLSFLTLTVAMAARWIASGNMPLSNGYETMLLLAWFVELIALILQRRFRIVMVFGFLLSGFFLLVSHINAMDPAIGQMMPVLNSPLLSVHVSIIMMSYALLSLTFICALMGLAMPRHDAELQALSRLFLYPAIAAMGIGVFIGAVWANVSWGSYWSWDSKETWALITLMIYAIAVHSTSLPALRRPRPYHWFMVLAFLSLIMTYFGVNYLLSGMHSYA